MVTGNLDAVGSNHVGEAARTEHELRILCLERTVGCRVCVGKVLTIGAVVDTPAAADGEAGVRSDLLAKPLGMSKLGRPAAVEQLCVALTIQPARPSCLLT